MPVIDYTAISTHLKTAQKDLVEQILQEANQRMQISQMARQIHQIDTYLERLGDPGGVDIDALRGIYGLIRELPLSQSAKDIARQINENYLFIDQPFYETVKREIFIGEEFLGYRDTSAYQPELVARKTIEEYRRVRAESMQRRQQIGRELKVAMAQLERATSDSEVQKLNALIETLNVQYSEASREVDLAAMEANMRYFQNQVEREIQGQAHFESQRAAHQRALLDNIGTFRLPTRPVQFDR